MTIFLYFDVTPDVERVSRTPHGLCIASNQLSQMSTLHPLVGPVGLGTAQSPRLGGRGWSSQCPRMWGGALETPRPQGDGSPSAPGPCPASAMPRLRHAPPPPRPAPLSPPLPTGPLRPRPLATASQPRRRAPSPSAWRPLPAASPPGSPSRSPRDPSALDRPQPKRPEPARQAGRRTRAGAVTSVRRAPDACVRARASLAGLRFPGGRAARPLPAGGTGPGSGRGAANPAATGRSEGGGSMLGGRRPAVRGAFVPPRRWRRRETALA